MFWIGLFQVVAALALLPLVRGNRHRVGVCILALVMGAGVMAIALVKHFGLLNI
jgi:hypothetical protein